MRVLLVLLTAFAASLPAFAADTRLMVAMPAEAREEMRAEMLDFQVALHDIVAALAAGRYAEAADIAETRVGVSAMGRHRNAPPNARPGMHMPNEMHAIARGMHVSATEFSKVARTGDTAKALGALGTVTGACVACHRSYRTQ